MQRLAAIFALALAVALPCPTPAKTKASPGPGATLSATPLTTCPADSPNVWVNTSSKIYWAPGTEYYGKTKHGGYACTKDAIAMGARAAKASPVGHHGAMSAAATDAPEAAATPKSKRHHRGGGQASPAPAPTSY